MEEFATFRKYNDPALAEDIAGILKANNIDLTVEEDNLNFDPAFTFNREITTEFLVKIRQKDFVKAEQALNESIQADNVAADHYLFAFTDDELRDVMVKADEWSNFDQVLARKILAERGIMIDDRELAALNSQRVEALRAPQKPQTALVTAGYIFAFLGGIASVFIGWHLAHAKKTLPDGERVFIYNSNDRQNGTRMFWIAIIVFVVAVTIRLFSTSTS